MMLPQDKIEIKNRRLGLLENQRLSRKSAKNHSLRYNCVTLSSGGNADAESTKLLDVELQALSRR